MAAGFLEDLSEEQRCAVSAPLGPALVIAGAGSGKTRVLTRRAAWLLSETAALPREIVALTFTNRAAREMRGRMEALSPAGAKPPFFGTFHSFTLRELRRHGSRIGLPQPFSVLSRRDQEEVVRRAVTKAGVPIEGGRVGPLIHAISRCKSGMSPDFPIGVDGEALLSAYQREARALGAIDFDDMLLLYRDLLHGDEELRHRARRELLHVLVDEFQDTNRMQYDILKLLRPPGEGGDTSLYCVGDDDQSIYAFRGADIGNILSFERDYPEAKLYHLERNYRSSTEILASAAEVVKGNRMRREKRLTAARGGRGKVELCIHASEADEARWVAAEVEREQGKGSVAVLYRVNAQSRAFEEALGARGIRYRMVGALRFYERREVKDLLSYLQAALQPQDAIAFARAASTPPRGIGEASLRALDEFARGRDLPLGNALSDFLRAQDKGGLTARAYQGFSDLQDTLLAVRAKGPAALPMLEEVLRRTGYRDHLQKDPQGVERLANVDALLTVAGEFDREMAEPDAVAFLSFASLETDEEDGNGEKAEAGVTLLTLHAAKGLEFRTVFLVGFEEGLLPHVSATKSQEELAEERRLLYVGMTRAKDRLCLSRSLRRRLYGKSDRAIPSRFERDLPPGSVTIHDYSPDQDPGVRFERAAAFLGYRKTEEVPPARPAAPAPARAGDAAAVARIAVPFGEGTRVRHDKFGAGVIIRREGSGDDLKLTVSFFGGHGRKKMIAKYANLTVLKD